MNYDEQLKIIKKGSVELIVENELKDKLTRKKTLKIKAGFDPTAPDLHLGHYILLRKLKELQELGHEILFLVGDFTAMIGDPTGKSETRKRLTREEVLVNTETYKEQVFKVLNPLKTKIVFNSSWCDSLSFEQVLGLTSKANVARLLERDDFEKRYKAGISISLIEFLYPLVQGYDSVQMESDLEIGGTDQKFNLLVGRDLQREYGKEPQCVLTMPLLVGLDGERKMSKSYGNYIGLNEKPVDIFGKIMSISDTLMWSYFSIFAENQVENYKSNVEKGFLHPKNAKVELAKIIMKEFIPVTFVESAIDEWNEIHNLKNRGIPKDVPETELGSEFFSESEEPLLLSVLTKIQFIPSFSEGRRLVQSGGLYLNEEKIENDKVTIQKGNRYLIRRGKKGNYIQLIT